VDDLDKVPSDVVAPLGGRPPLLDRSPSSRIRMGLGTIAGLGILVLMLVTTADVALRATSNGGIASAVEVTEVLLVVVVFVGMAGAQLAGSHISTPLVTSRLPRRVAARVRTAACLLSVGLVLWLTYETGVAALESVRIREFRYGLVRIPVWPSKVGVPVGFGLLALVLVHDLRRQVGSLRNHKRPLMVDGRRGSTGAGSGRR